MQHDNRLGPQHRQDNLLAARMRLHQSWYRANVLKVTLGTGPGPNATATWGSMLTREDGAKGLNLLTPELFELAKKRIADKTGTVDEFRLLHNLLSSQPMCFNLFGYLELQQNFATRIFAALDADVGEVTGVRMEFAPSPAKEYLADRTAFDAFVEYERAGGGKGFFGIETKLTELFSQQEYDTKAYRQWTAQDGSPWRKDGRDRLQEKAHNQLWRNHLLVYALQERSQEFDVGTIVVTGHPLDVGLNKTIAGYRELLVDPECLRVWPMDRIIEAAEDAIEDDAQREWLEAFKVRYLRLDLSEQAWQAHLESRGARR